MQQVERDDRTAQNALAAAAQAARELEERDDAVAEVVALKARDAEVQAARAELEAARRAAGVADVARQSREAAADLEQGRAAAEMATAAASAAAAAKTAAATILETEVSRTGEREHAAAEIRRLRAFEAGAEALVEARRSLGQAATELASRRREVEAADSAWAAARDRLTALEAAWGEAQAGLLARSLRDGRPCPVCGSPEHPAPAALPHEAPSEDDVEAARTEVAVALERRDEARAGHQKAEATHAAAEALAGERAAGIPEDLADPVALNAAISAAERLATELTAAYDQAVAARHEADVAASTRAAERDAAGVALAKAKEKTGVAAALLAERLAQAGFAGEDDLAAAVRPPAAVEQLATLVKAHEDATLKAAERRRLAEDKAAEHTIPDLDALEEAAARTSAAAGAARDAVAALRADADSADRLFERLCRLDDEATGVAARYESVGRLAEVAGGRNGRRLSFQSYVLGAFLDDVLVTASERLRIMSKNRYALERTEERSGRRQAAGLDLVTYDAWTGVSRPVSTLSGGEKFMAALSLALGLAEVVQAHAGGIRLETVFVDEGFGSLDDESLDLAVAALMGLGESGRLVGIISHVSELRERIDARLEVSTGTNGSTAAFRVG